MKVKGGKIWLQMLAQGNAFIFSRSVGVLLIVVFSFLAMSAQNRPILIDDRESGFAKVRGYLLSSPSVLTRITEYFEHSKFLQNSSSLTTITFDDVARGNGALAGNEYVAQGLTIVQRDSLPINVL